MAPTENRKSATSVFLQKMEDQEAKTTDFFNKLVDHISVKSRKLDWGSKSVDSILKRVCAMEDEILKARLKGDKTRADLLQKQADKLAETFGNPKSKRVVARAMGDAAQTFGEGLHGAFQAFKSKDLGQMAGMLKKMGQSATKSGAKMEGTAVKGMGGDAIAGMGKALSAIGPAIAAFAGVALGIAALIKIVLDADSRIKDLNKSMIAAGISGQEFGTNVGEGMQVMQAAFSGVGAIEYLEEFGSTTQENIAIIGAFQKAGTTFHEVGGDVGEAADRVNDLRDAARGALVYSKLLGESSDKVAGDMAKMAEETSTTLEGVRSKFSEIAGAAKQSGFDTKRFYGMVLEVTTGMSMYNVRLQDTIGLLMQAGKVLGPDAGKAWAQSLTGGMKEVSTREMTVNAMKMGKGNVRGAAKLDATDQASALKDSFMSIQKAQGKPAEQMAAAFKLAGVDNLAGMKPEDIEKTLGNMSKENALILRSELNNVEGVSGLGTKTAHAQKVARAGEGLGGLGGQVEGMKNFGAIGTLLAKIGGSNAVDKGLDTKELDPEKLAKNMAKESLQSGAGALTSQDKDMIWNAMGSLKAKQKTEGKNAGNTITNENVAKELGLMKKAEDAAAKTAKEEADKKENAWKTDQDLAQQVVDNTRSLSDIMGNRIEQILTSISGTVEDILNSMPSFLTGGAPQRAADRKAKDEAIKGLANLIDDRAQKMGVEKDPVKLAEMKQAQDINKAQIKNIKASKTSGLSALGYQQEGGLKAINESGSTDPGLLAQAEDFAESVGPIQIQDKIPGAVSYANRNVFDYDMFGPGAGELAANARGVQHNKNQQKLDAANNDSVSFTDPNGGDFYAHDAKGDGKKGPQSAAEKKDDIANQDAANKKSEKRVKIIDEKLGERNADLNAKAIHDMEVKDAVDKAIGAMNGENSASDKADLQAELSGTSVRGSERSTQARRALGLPPRVEDGILTLDRGDGNPLMHRIDSDDSVIGIGKPGGPLSKGGGGNITISVNQWGDVPGAILKALETMRVRT